MNLAAVRKALPQNDFDERRRYLTELLSTPSVINHYLHMKPKVAVSKELVTGTRLIRFDFNKERIVSKSNIPFEICLEYSAERPVITEFCILIFTLRGYRVAILDLRNYARQLCLRQR